MTFANLKSTLEASLRSMEVIPAMVAGSLSREDLQYVALNQYGEIRSFIDVKLPARLYICPHDAMSAKKYFHYLYAEEQGFFGKEPNHAELFIPVCTDLGIDRVQLEAYYKKYEQYCFHLFKKEATVANLVEQLAISYAWETVTPFLGKSTLEAFQRNYDFSETAMRYFELHFAVDTDHANEAERVLREYCTTDVLYEIAEGAIKSTLGSDLYLTKRL